jgi:hypothetical protein
MAVISYSSLQQLTATTLFFVSGLSVAGNILPTETHEPPAGTYRFHAEGERYYTFGGEQIRQVRQLEVIEAFATKLLIESREMDPEIAHILNEHFMDIYEPI